MKTASYRQGVQWIAQNDEVLDRDPEVIAGYISSILLADLFGIDPERVGRDVSRVRAKMWAKEAK